jgi:hypothetical protein
MTNPKRKWTALALISMIGASWGCTSIGTLGMVTKSEADPASILKSGRPFKELGPAEGNACKYILLSIVPWGESDLESAVGRALKKSGGDALINVSVANSLYSFLPIYNILSISCTAVKGISVKFQ